MRELRLDFDALQVESFEPAPALVSEPAAADPAYAAAPPTVPLSDCVWSLCRTCGIVCTE